MENKLKEILNYLISSILAGLCISIGCIVNLMVGCGPLGAILFTFGLITVVHYKYALFTGTAGFIKSFNDFCSLFGIVLLGNWLGCYITSEVITYAIPDITEKANSIVLSRTNVNIWQAMIRGVFCGFLMTTAVKFARENRWLPLIFAVPVFILAGFYHSIADCFYISASDYSFLIADGNFHDRFAIHNNWVMTIVGNFIGCNLYRLKFIDN